MLDRARVRLDFWGTIPDYLADLAADHGVSDLVRRHGFVPREQVLAKQRRAQLLLLFAWTGRSRRGHHTAKLYDYLAARRPILAIGPGGDVIERFLQESQAGWYSFDDAGLEAALRQAWGAYCAAGYVAYTPRPEALERYEHPRMAARFAELLDQVSAGWGRR